MHRYVRILPLLLACGCGSQEPPADLSWWTGAEPTGDCTLPAAADASGVYFVSPAGDDGAAGTLDAPWRTLSHATQTLAAGDTVFLRDGTYPEVLVPGASGSEDAWITYAAYPGEQPTIDGSSISLGASEGLVQLADRSWIRLCGLRVEHAGPNRNANGILVETSSHVVIGDCSTYDTTSSGIGVWNSDNVVITDNEVELACNDGEQECLTVATTDLFVVRNNHVHDGGPGTIGGEGIDVKDGSSRGYVYGNDVHDNHRLGIYVEAWDKHTHDLYVYGNLSHDNHGGDGITLSSEQGGLLQNVRVYNNLVWSNGCNGIALALNNRSPTVSWHPLEDIEVVNNTVVDNGSADCAGNDWGGGIMVDAPDVYDVVIRNNVVTDNRLYQLFLDGRVDAEQVLFDHNLLDGVREEMDEEVLGEASVMGDPQFVDAVSADFHVASASPAVDAGVQELSPEDDYDGVARPQGAGVDIGAFER